MLQVPVVSLDAAVAQLWQALDPPGQAHRIAWARDAGPALADVARRHYGPLGALAGKRFDSLARIARLQVPLLVAHGDQDEIVPFEQGERLFSP